MPIRGTARTLAILTIASALFAAGCGDDDDTANDNGTEGSCATGDLNLVSDGELTVGTDDPAFPPWFEDDEPGNGKGFESAVAYAVADELGLAKDDVTWTTVAFNNAFAPGDKDFDFDINQVSISPERKQAVDFSEGYYDVNQAIVGFTDSPAASATTVEQLQGLKLGAQLGTTSLAFIQEVIKPTSEPFVYNDNNAAKAALDARQVDAIVLDLPTAFYVSSNEIPGTTVIGQFPATAVAPEQFGMVFEKGNSLRDCVNQALTRLKDRGELDQIEQEWLSDYVDAPVIPVN